MTEIACVQRKNCTHLFFHLIHMVVCLTGSHGGHAHGQYDSLRDLLMGHCNPATCRVRGARPHGCPKQSSHDGFTRRHLQHLFWTRWIRCRERHLLLGVWITRKLEGLSPPPLFIGQMHVRPIMTGEWGVGVGMGVGCIILICQFCLTQAWLVAKSPGRTTP